MRKCSKLSLYAVTDEKITDDALFLKGVEEALLGGIDVLQLREKSLSEEAFLKRAKACQALCAKYGVSFIVNDRVEIAKAIGAYGVHIGQSDLEAGKARHYLGEEKIIGVSVRTLEEALLAEKNGADYLGVGAVFGTATKLDAKKVSIETLKEIANKVSIPVVAIGGINQDNMLSLEGTGISGVAVVSAIFGQEEIKESTKRLKEKVKKILGEVQ